MIDNTHSKGQQGRTNTTISWLSFRLYVSAMVSYDVEVMGSLANPGKTIVDILREDHQHESPARYCNLKCTYNFSTIVHSILYMKK